MMPVFELPDMSRWEKGYCKCGVKCEDTAWGNKNGPIDESVIKEHVSQLQAGITARNDLGGFDLGTQLKVVYGDCGGAGFNLTCPGLVPLEKPRYPKTGNPMMNTQPVLVVCIRNAQSTCEAREWATHELAHVAQYLALWKRFRYNPVMLNNADYNGLRQKWEEEAYRKSCGERADMDCVTDKRERERAIDVCVNSYKPNSTGNVGVANISQACQTVLQQEFPNSVPLTGKQ